jgi:hypothetical protein
MTPNFYIGYGPHHYLHRDKALRSREILLDNEREVSHHLFTPASTGFMRQRPSNKPLLEGFPKASPSPLAISHVGTNKGQIFVYSKVKKKSKSRVATYLAK